MNHITLIGNLTHDPEMRTTPNGISVCTFNIAVNRRFAGKDGQKQTDYFRINAWRQLGESCGKYLEKGRKVAVIGELQARMYETRNGDQRMSLDVEADEVEFLTPNSVAKKDENEEHKDEYDQAAFTEMNSEDLPF